MVEHGASIQYVEGICTIRINDNYPYKAIIERVLRDLRASILSHDYISNYMI
ncbi:MAG: hypothetical protein JRI26_13005 [Deltaproteobacteria bacterium]|nr:hypothetical protein [Deltaproteobacteria bacterium]